MCEFCENKKFMPTEYAGRGIRTVADMINELCGADEPTSGGDIKIMEDEDGFYLSYDNSSDEYADGMVEINYCPMCGRNLRGKQP